MPRQPKKTSKKTQGAATPLMQQYYKVKEEHPGALLGQPPGDRTAQTLCSPGHNRDLILQSLHLPTSLLGGGGLQAAVRRAKGSKE